MYYSSTVRRYVGSTFRLRGLEPENEAIVSVHADLPFAQDSFIKP